MKLTISVLILSLLSYALANELNIFDDFESINELLGSEYDQYIAKGGDICGIRTDVPCIHVRKCSAPGPKARISGFKVSNQKNTPTAHPTVIEMCFDRYAIHIKTFNSDPAIYTPHTKCNSPVWQSSSVSEIFIAPISKVHNDPQWYWEIDVTPSAATFASLIFNQKGTTNNCILGGCTAGELKCSGQKDFFPHTFDVLTHVDRPHKTWSTSLKIPFTIFPVAYRTANLFRMNFYRYTYTQPNAKGTAELSAWSPTHSPSFHVPSRFGIVVLDN